MNGTPDMEKGGWQFRGLIARFGVGSFVISHKYVANGGKSEKFEAHRHFMSFGAKTAFLI